MHHFEVPVAHYQTIKFGGPHRLTYRVITCSYLSINSWMLTHCRALSYRKVQLLCVMFSSWWRSGETKKVHQSALQHSPFNNFIVKDLLRHPRCTHSTTAAKKLYLQLHITSEFGDYKYYGLVQEMFEQHIQTCSWDIFKCGVLSSLTSDCALGKLKFGIFQLTSLTTDF